MGRESRDVYKPGANEDGVYLHLFNRCVGSGSYFPFGEKEKEKFFKHLKWHLQLYSIECLSAVVMSNHYHLVLYVPKKALTAAEVFENVKPRKKGELIKSPEDSYCVMRSSMSNDLGAFMKEVQQGFTIWFNKTRKDKRVGTLWQQRYKCTKLADAQALATCIQYVELNPFRAALVKDPAKYKYSSYGKWMQSGRHPFGKVFTDHMIPALRGYLNTENAKGVKEYYQERFTKILASKNKKNPSVLLKRSRYWTDSFVLGGSDTLRDEAVVIWGKERGNKKKFGKVLKEDGYDLRSMRQLIVDK